MPKKAARPCRCPGCPALTTAPTRLCPEHEKADRAYTEANRPTASQRGYNTRWRKARTAYLAEHPICVLCQKDGRLTPATTVDHVTPHRGDWQIFWDESNWQPLCEHHHNVKTARESGYGRTALGV